MSSLHRQRFLARHRLIRQGACDVCQPAPEATVIEIAKAEVAVEVASLRGHGINDNGARAKLATASHTTRKCVDEQVTAERPSVLGAIQREASEQNDGHGVWHPAPQARGSSRVSYSAHRHGVVADHSLVAAEHIGRRGPRRRGDAGRLAQPQVEDVNPTVEGLEIVRIGEGLYRT